MEDKIIQLFFDNCMFEACNFACDYCRSESASSLDNLQIKDDLKKRMEIVDNFVDYQILKISGYGEITLLKNFLDLLSNEPESKSIQLITNGYSLNKGLIDKLAEIENLSLCLSLDGNKLETNFCRTKEQTKLDKILENLTYIGKKNIPLEINSVLTCYNTARFNEFLHFISNELGDVVSFQFPVRPFSGKDNYNLYPSIRDTEKFKEEIIGNYSSFSRILPPKLYLERMITFTQSSTKGWRCYVPEINIGVNHHGDVLACACGVKEKLGNIFEDPEKTFENKKNSKQKFWNECKNCFNHYEILNLFMEEFMNIQEISRIPSLRGQHIEKSLEYLKKQI